MWLIVWARARRWLLTAAVLPVVAILVGLVRQRIERRRGSTAATRFLERLEQVAGGRRPVARPAPPRRWLARSR